MAGRVKIFLLTMSRMWSDLVQFSVVRVASGQKKNEPRRNSAVLRDADNNDVIPVFEGINLHNLLYPVSVSDLTDL